MCWFGINKTSLNPKKGHEMKLTENLLFITYYLKRNAGKFDLTYKGCREVICFDYDLPSYIKGIIEFDEEYVSVIDPNIYFHGQQSLLSNLACILIIEYAFENRKYKAGIIIEDIDEIMNFAAGGYNDSSFKAPFTFNMSFIVDVLHKGRAEQFLSNTYKLLNMHEKRKHIMKRSVVDCNDDVLKTKLVEQTPGEFNIFNTNEFLVSI